MEETIKFKKKMSLEEYDIHTEGSLDNIICSLLHNFYRRHFKEATGYTEEWIEQQMLVVFNNAYKVYHDLVDGAEISPLTVKGKTLIMPNGDPLEKELYYPQTAMPMLYFLLQEYASKVKDIHRRSAVVICMRNLYEAFVDDTEFFSMLQEAFAPENRFRGYRRFITAVDVEGVLAALHEKLGKAKGGKDRVLILWNFEGRDLKPYYDEDSGQTLPGYKEAFLEEFYSSKSKKEKESIWRGMLPYLSGDRRYDLEIKTRRTRYIASI